MYEVEFSFGMEIAKLYPLPSPPPQAEEGIYRKISPYKIPPPTYEERLRGGNLKKHPHKKSSLRLRGEARRGEFKKTSS
ncbi:hypothetical protein [Pasteurella atlantica]|uniref:hypothetical protein n=1 Tax=Pasteurella atlantica TaxID=2827233 RepID=UPI00278C4B4E|nr:hypothetical protein [Pasteurella atlantica]